MRAFVAITVPDLPAGQLVALQRALTVGRPVPEENLHLTLCFLGEQDEEAVVEAHDTLSAISMPSFELQLAGLGTFGNRTPHVVVAEVAKSEALEALQARITRSLRNAGLGFEKRRFRPHVTIARLPNTLAPDELERIRRFLEERGGFRGSPFKVEHFTLYRSVLKPEAARHDELARYELTGVTD